jgi:tetratricopeptide (TPR) repeat protein
LEADRQWVALEATLRDLLRAMGPTAGPEALAEQYVRLGRVELRLDKRDKAERRVATACRYVADHPPALRLLIELRGLEQDWTGYLEACNRLLLVLEDSRDPRWHELRVSTWLDKARVLDEALSRPDKAARHLEELLDLDFQQEEALLWLVELALRRDAPAEALRWTHRARAQAAATDPALGALLVLIETSLAPEGQRLTPELQARIALFSKDWAENLAAGQRPAPAELAGWLGYLLRHRRASPLAGPQARE